MALMTIGAVGIVFVAVGMGNAVQLLKYTPIFKQRKIKLYEINQSIKRLLDRKLIKIREDRDHKFLEVTDTGKRLLLKYKLEGLAEEKPKKWDRKYRTVVFDISEQRKKTRDHLRRMLRGFGFICLQGSVWVYPYHCEEIVSLLKEYLQLRGEVIYMTVESIENDGWIKKRFDL